MIEFAAKSLRRLATAFNSAWVRARLGSCGPKLSAGFPSRLDRPAAASFGSRISLGEHAWINCGGPGKDAIRLVIGDGCSIGRFAHINARDSVIIEDQVLIAERVFITDYHHSSLNLTVPIMCQPLTEPRPVRICRGAWIGEGASIMPGVTIGEGAVVGAGAVVTRHVPAGAVARGVPARNYERDGKEVKK